MVAEIHSARMTLDLDVVAPFTVEPFGAYPSVPTVEAAVFGHTCRVIELDALIEVKRLAGRRKDIEALHELEALRERRML
jgi:hypothetical protein